MEMPGFHSLLWKLAGALGIFCLLVLSLHIDLGKRINAATSHLSDEAKFQLTQYAQEAEAVWRARGEAGVDEFLEELHARESVWAVVVDEHQQSLSSRPLSEREWTRLSFIRALDWSMGRPNGWPTVYIPFSDGVSRLVMELPRRFNPKESRALLSMLLQQVLPVCLAILLGGLLYRAFISPLTILRRQANALRADDLSARAGAVAQRRDELGELGRAFDHMAERLEHTVEFQRQLLCDLSHELRTPLSRLSVAAEQNLDLATLRQRLEREVQGMERLVGDTLELVWLDTERPNLPLCLVDVARLWEVLCENACFESGWSAGRLSCELPEDCRVQGNLNGLAQALENILRNAIRHSPANGVVRLAGRRDGDYWHLWIEDQGPGVADGELERIFQPFTRLNVARPGGGGFGLGLAIARSMVQLQGGELWAENRNPGLRLNLRLKSV
ncbi:two-component sensor histidine kinase [Stutzerimonas kirkiae]|uniref:histidine kinase n=1 Tax=Stutzerimonas kirkiae TaxID=2211392 RepID=A0A4Q9R2N4_9GAMM|nr:sensor histidine kinase [Stutzerimonas kirkiae]TBU92691.1 two-component sensor histidine kinase [Stutzerimonas kirkiae]TBV00852.1 two-component sensor histidine kinase [Stutzerimonas kirkiae]TBV11519.1 two-component sensor histidine kinase [Stutzerimonas kirkiae]